MSSTHPLIPTHPPPPTPQPPSPHTHPHLCLQVRLHQVLRHILVGLRGGEEHVHLELRVVQLEHQALCMQLVSILQHSPAQQEEVGGVCVNKC